MDMVILKFITTASMPVPASSQIYVLYCNCIFK